VRSLWDGANGLLDFHAAVITSSIPIPRPSRLDIDCRSANWRAGRRLLSDDLVFLESVALMVARRIDAARVIHERCLRDLQEQEMRKLATEAELRALRAQINPHFLIDCL
jgi:hypothetical protein